MGKIRNFFKRGKGSTSRILVPHFKNSETAKKYHNTIDIIFDKTHDFKQLIMRLQLMFGLSKAFQNISMSSSSDSYQVLSFMETGINTLVMQIESTIQSEFRYREEIIKAEGLYQDLTSLTLEENQKADLLEFEAIHKEDYLSRATSLREKNIVEGLTSAKSILQSKHDIQGHKIQKENDTLEFAELKSKHFKPVSSNDQKRHFHRKINEYPILAKSSMKSLQHSLDGIKNIQNGLGTKKDIEMAETDSNTTNNQLTTQNK